MKKIVVVTLLALLFPTLLCAQHPLKKLTLSYSTHPDVEYLEAGKAIIWMIKAKSPKGAMDGVKLIDILTFDGKKSGDVYTKFRQEMLAEYARHGISCVKSERSKDGLAEVYMQKDKPNLTEYSMFMINDNGDKVFMRLEGEMKFSAVR